MTTDQQIIFQAKAHFTKNLLLLINPYLQFRAYLKFKSSKEHGVNRKCHFYGMEFKATYSQCIHGYLPNIELDRLHGYNMLIDLIERKYKGKHVTAEIYSESVIGLNPRKFDILHRKYLNGKLDKKNVNDPIFDSINPDKKIIYYTVNQGRLVLSETSFDII